MIRFINTLILSLALTAPALAQTLEPFSTYMSSRASASSINGTEPTLILQNGGVKQYPVVSQAPSWFDTAFCSTIGQYLVRLSTKWGCATAVPIDVTMFGATGNGVTDDTAAINAAIAALPNAGGEVSFKPGGTYCITSPIVIGNGSSSQQSTLQGPYLRVAGNSMNQSTLIKWCGTSNTGSMITFSGPMHGWGMSGINLSCNSLITTGLHINAVQFGLVQNVRFDTCTQSMLSTTLATAAVGSPNTAENVFHNIQVLIPDVASAVGFFLTGDSVDQVTDSNLNTFISVDMITSSSKTTISSVYLQNADGNVFQNFTGGGGQTNCITFDYNAPGGSGTWPSNNMFYFADCINFPSGGVIARNIGSPTVGAAPNRFIGVADDNRMMMPALANFAYMVEAWGPGVDIVAQTTGQSGGVLNPVVTIAGSPNTFEVCGVLAVKATSNGGGSLQWSTSALNDNNNLLSVFSSSINTNAVNWTSSCIPLRVANGAGIFWGTNITGVLSGATYDFHARLKKLD